MSISSGFPVFRGNVVMTGLIVRKEHIFSLVGWFSITSSSISHSLVQRVRIMKRRRSRESCVLSTVIAVAQ